MEERIQLEKRKKDPSQIKELVLDDCRSTYIVGLTDEFCNLEMLSMTNVGLTNLKNFPNLPKLKLLDLSDNRIEDGLTHLVGSPKLRSLILSGNKIDNFEALEPLICFQDLEYLELSECPITRLEQYRHKVFTLLPKLNFLDDLKADFNEESAVLKANESNNVKEKEDVFQRDEGMEFQHLANRIGGNISKDHRKDEDNIELIDLTNEDEEELYFLLE